MPVNGLETVGRRSITLSARAALALLLLLAFLHGALYALFLPPWGLIDEAQHLHYIQYIAEQQSLPVAGELYLSDEIVASLFATQRWQTFTGRRHLRPTRKRWGWRGTAMRPISRPFFIWR